MKNQRSNFVMGMNMPDEIYDQGIPVFIRQDHSDIFVSKLREEDNKKFQYAYVKDHQLYKQTRKARYANIYPFGMIETAYHADEKSLKRAKLINYLYETADYDLYKFTSLESLDAMPSKQIWQKRRNIGEARICQWL